MRVSYLYTWSMIISIFQTTPSSPSSNAPPTPPYPVSTTSPQLHTCVWRLCDYVNDRGTTHWSKRHLPVVMVTHSKWNCCLITSLCPKMPPKCKWGFSPGECYLELDKEGKPTSKNRKPSTQDSAESNLTLLEFSAPSSHVVCLPVSKNTASCSPGPGSMPCDLCSIPPTSVHSQSDKNENLIVTIKKYFKDRLICS